jgi:hypothetical protein
MAVPARGRLLDTVVVRWAYVPGPAGNVYVATTDLGVAYLRAAGSAEEFAGLFRGLAAAACSFLCPVSTSSSWTVSATPRSSGGVSTRCQKTKGETPATDVSQRIGNHLVPFWRPKHQLPRSAGIVGPPEPGA